MEERSQRLRWCPHSNDYVASIGEEKMLGLNEMEIVDLLGKPDKQELYKRNQKFYRYYLQPGPACSAPRFKREETRSSIQCSGPSKGN